MSKTSISLANTLLALSLTLHLSGCVTTLNPSFEIDKTYQAQGQNQRIQFIVLHYTAENDADSLKILTQKQVSAHYLIPATNDYKIYQLVDDDKRAWHAGSGSFAGRSVLNDTSIGIEIVNDGIAQPYRGVLKDQGLTYHPQEHFVDYKDIQIAKTAQLIQGLADKYQIDPKNIIGHSDMAPSRKIDSGAKFPWERLYKEFGVGAWYDETY